MCQLEQLEWLDFGYNNQKQYRREIGDLNNLKGLVLSRNRIVYLPVEIGNLERLEWLDLNVNLIRKFYDEILHLEKLKVLGLSGNLINTLPEDLDVLRNLESLDITFEEKRTNRSTDRIG